MDKIHVFIIFICCFIPFLFYFSNPLLAYYDSYAFLAGSCGVNTGFVIPFIPCNIFVVKLVLFFCFFVSALSIAFFGESVVGRELGWKVGLFSVAFCPLFFQEVVKFENDVFGWTFSFIGLALFSIGLFSNKSLKRILLMFLGTITIVFSTFIWFSTYLILLAVFSLCIYTILISFLIILPILNQIISRITNLTTITSTKTQTILEELPLVGIFNIIYFLPGLKFIPKKILIPTIILFGAGLIQNKFMILSIPFLAIGFTLFVEKIEKFKGVPSFVILSFIMVIAMGFFSLNVSPTITEMNLVNQGIAFANDNNIVLFNDWTYGWWVTYRGYETEFKSSYPNPDYNNLSKPFVALTQKDLNHLNCVLLKKENKIRLYNCG